ncbi:MAG: 16S rRNA (guanine(527)-N(7))-methyltransferase RsmG [Proteobacteria bacterium]|nr:16S rRNA (guanine(527)-N(7))-methyltransferase RsmG [Pseudomonadota bacterium]
MRKTVQIADKIEKEFPNLKLSENSLVKLEQYLDLLFFWNKKINLTAIRERDVAIVKHLLDSIVVLNIKKIKHLKELTTGHVIDFGSGAGFPGIVLAICQPEMNLVSIDKAGKKIAFQQQLVRQLSVNNVQPLQTRLQDLIKIQVNKLAYDVIISRAFDQIKNILYFGEHLLKPNGYFLLWKGERWQEEMKETDNSLLGKHKLLLSHRYEFEEFGHGGVILLIQKLDSMESNG